MYTCKNFRQNPGCSFSGSSASTSTVIADLYDENGKFYRVAVVAECSSPEYARRYANEQNAAIAATSPEILEIPENSENLENS